MGHGGQQGRLGGPRPRARAHHLRLGRRVRRVLRGAVEDLHSRGMYFIEKYVCLQVTCCTSAVVERKSSMYRDPMISLCFSSACTERRSVDIVT